MLAAAEERVDSAQGAAAVFADKQAMAAILDALKRPASGSAYTQVKNNH